MELEENKKEKYDRPPFSAQQQQQHPWLVICHGEDLEKQTFFSVSENRYYMRRIPELKDKIICAYADEWLVLESIYSGDVYLWNLISYEKIQLPPLPAGCDILKCLLSTPPHDPECQVLFLIKENETNSGDDENSDEETETNSDDDENSDEETETNLDDDENSDEDDNSDADEDANPPTFYFCKPDYNEEFHKQEIPSIIGDWCLCIWTVFKKKIYVLAAQTDILMCLDRENDSGTITVTSIANESPDLPRKFLDMPRFENYIIQSSFDDMMLYVHLYLNGKNHEMPYHFLVFRFDFVKKIWIEVESIGEIAIFISFSKRTGTTCSTRGTDLDNESIYFTYGRYLYVYNLISHTISLSLPCQHVSKTNTHHMHWLTLN